ncbi:MAG: D-alanine--D-serine ligase VanG [Bulleidia sp.]
MKHKCIAVLFGGKSSEYAVSLQSAQAVLEHLDHTKYDILPIGITQSGKWYLYTGAYENIGNDSWHTTGQIHPVTIHPGEPVILTEHGSCTIDAVFPVMHGKNGEDGTVQGMFELAGIPVIGCGVLSSALCMDKQRAHNLVSYHGIHCAESVVITDIAQAKDALKTISFPLYIKPVRSGSSIGIHRCTDESQITAALQDAFSHDSQVILEEEITGIEVGCSLIGNDDLITGRVDEIELSSGFFDYEEKYTLKTSSIHMPVRLPEAEEKRIIETGKQIYRILGCSGFARVDMFYTPDGTIYFNEVNTIPGFTSHSRFPNMMKGIGLCFEDVLERIIGCVL